MKRMASLLLAVLLVVTTPLTAYAQQVEVMDAMEIAEYAAILEEVETMRIAPMSLTGGGLIAGALAAPHVAAIIAILAVGGYTIHWASTHKDAVVGMVTSVYNGVTDAARAAIDDAVLKAQITGQLILGAGSALISQVKDAFGSVMAGTDAAFQAGLEGTQFFTGEVPAYQITEGISFGSVFQIPIESIVADQSIIWFSNSNTSSATCYGFIWVDGQLKYARLKTNAGFAYNYGQYYSKEHFYSVGVLNSNPVFYDYETARDYAVAHKMLVYLATSSSYILPALRYTSIYNCYTIDSNGVLSTSANQKQSLVPSFTSNIYGVYPTSIPMTMSVAGTVTYAPGYDLAPGYENVKDLVIPFPTTDISIPATDVGVLTTDMPKVLAGDFADTLAAGGIKDQEKEQEGAKTDALLGDGTIADVQAQERTLGAVFTSKFPFCIPWDFANAVRLLAAPAKTPHWEVDFLAPLADRVGGWKGETTIVIDFEQFAVLGQLSRWLSTLLFVAALISATKKLIWTA